MRSIQEHISHKQLAIADHPFLAGLRPEPVLERALWFAPLTAFWAMGFQDVLRLNTERVEDSGLREILLQHRIEDSGHDSWYLQDLQVMGRRDIDLGWLYGEDCRSTRDATYAIAAEAITCKHDVLRLVLALALEGAGHVMFGKVTKNLVQSGHAARLRYFASSHLDVEYAHDLFTQQIQDWMQRITLTEDLRVQSLELIDRVFAAFRMMADGFVKVKPREIEG
jgi:hypothetical protein